MHWTLALVGLGAVWSLAAWWRPGSIALALSWMAAQCVWLATGEYVPVWFYIPADLCVLAVLLYYRASRLDYLIAAIFPLQWALYSWPDAVQQWWGLWGLVMLQFIIAGPWKYTRPFNGPNKLGLRRHHAGA